MASKILLQGVLSCIIIACLSSLVQSRSLPYNEDKSLEPQDESQSIDVSVHRRSIRQRRPNFRDIKLISAGSMALDSTDQDQKFTVKVDGHIRTYVEFSSPPIPLRDEESNDTFYHLNVDLNKLEGKSFKLVAEKGTNSAVKIRAFVEVEGQSTNVKVNQDNWISTKTT